MLFAATFHPLCTIQILGTSDGEVHAFDVGELLLLRQDAGSDASPLPVIMGSLHHKEAMQSRDLSWRSSQLLSGGTLRRMAEAAEKRVSDPGRHDGQVWLVASRTWMYS